MSNYDEVSAIANGRWREILSGLGVDDKYLTKKPNEHGPCPGCGGTDRFRYDDIGGRGTFVCNAGGELVAGDGFELLRHVHGWDKAEGLHQVARFLGLDDRQPMTKAEWAKLKRQAKERRQKAEAEKLEQEAKVLALQEKAASLAELILEAADGEPDEHPYAVRKEVPLTEFVGRGTWPKKEWGDALVVPLFDESGRIWNIEAINEDGEKDSLKGGKRSGCFHPFGRVRGADRVLIGEGLATVAAVHDVTGWPALAAMTAANLLNVAAIARKLAAPGAEIILLADNDIKPDKKPNAGVLAATKAAQEVGGRVAIPELAGNACDFWDLWHERGPEAVREAIDKALTDPEPEAYLYPDTLPQPCPRCGEAGGYPVCSVCTAAPNVIEAALLAVENDAGAVFEPDVLDALRTLKAGNLAEWQRLRGKIKAANKAVKITDLDRAISGSADGATDDTSIADTLVALAMEACELFHDEDGEPYASFERNGHRETWALWSKGYQEWLSFQLYQMTGKAPRKASLDDATATLAGMAKFEGETRSVALRVAQQNGRYYLDLGNDAWQVVEIEATGWRVLNESPVRFVRNSTLRALPVPQLGGSIDPLWDLINIPEPARPMVLVWLLECLRPDTPYALLELTGEQGSAKSTTQSILRDLIDPNEVNLRAAPKGREDIFIAAKNGHLVSFENLSHLSADYQDALCTLATGGGFATRTLYTNADETVIKLKRPVVLNGISVVVTAQDLVDRALHVDLPTIEERRTASEVEQEFEARRPSLLGAILDLFVLALRILPYIDIPARERPRMADFAFLGEAVYRVLGYQDGAFLEAYQAMRVEGVHRTLDSSPVATAVLDALAVRAGGLEGTAKELLAVLSAFKPDDAAGWPKSAKGLGDALRRAKPALRMLGVDIIDLGRSKHGYQIAIRSTPKQSSPSSRSTPSSPEATKFTPSSPQVHPSNPYGTRASELGELGEHKNGILYSTEKNTSPDDDREVFEI